MTYRRSGGQDMESRIRVSAQPLEWTLFNRKDMP